MATKRPKTYSLAEMKDKYIGKVGTQERVNFEYALSMDVLFKMIKAARKERKLTHEEIGRLIG
ncbi:MAG: transcriptional regulator, partial [Bacteroidota bacterium]